MMNLDVFVADRGKHKFTKEMRIAFIKDPLLAVDCIFGFKLAYFQITRLYESWFKTSFMDCSGYGTGKTFHIALLMALRGILLPNRTQMIISHTYGGVKLIFDTYLEPWFFELPNYKEHFGEQVKNPVSKTSDLYAVRFENGNEIRGVPPAIMTGATRLRSERCNDIYLDEWAHYQSQQEIDTVIKSRATRYNPFHKIQPTTKDEQLIKNALANHKSFFSTPNYKFHESYNRAKFFIRKAHIEKHTNYGYEAYNYLDLIDDGREDLTDIEAIEESKAMLPSDLFDRDYLGKWVDASIGFYNFQTIKKNRSQLAKPLLKGKGDDIFIKGVDVARSIKGKGDDFAISVIRFEPRPDHPHEFVYQLTKNNLEAEQMAEYIQTMDELFPGPIIMIDPGGGGQFLTGPLAKEEFNVSGGTKKVMPIYEVDSPASGGKNILYFFSRGTRLINEVIGKMSGDDVLVNNAHNIMKTFLENEKIIIPYSENINTLFNKMLDTDYKKRFGANDLLDEMEHAYYNIELTMHQLQSIEREKDRQTGEPKLTARGQFSFTSRGKKDSAYSFLYAIFGTYLYERLTETDAKTTDAIGNAIRDEFENVTEILPLKTKPSEAKKHEEEGIYSFTAI